MELAPDYNFVSQTIKHFKRKKKKPKIPKVLKIRECIGYMLKAMHEIYLHVRTRVRPPAGDPHYISPSAEIGLYQG